MMSGRLLLPCALVALLTAPIPAAAVDLVVIGTSSPERFEKGQIVDGDIMLKLPEGENVTFIDDAGNVTKVLGPYSGMIGSPAGGGSRDLLELFSGLFESRSTTALAATRRLFVERPTDPWAIDISAPGDKCVATAQQTMLWRPDPGIPATVVLADADTMDAVSIKWPARVSYITWPVDMPLKHQRQYEVEIVEGIPSVQITLHVAEEGFENGVEVAAWMARSGCDPQALTQIDNLPVVELSSQ